MTRRREDGRPRRERDGEHGNSPERRIYSTARMEPPFVILDFPPSGARPAGSLLFEEPREVLAATAFGHVREVLHAADARAAAGLHVAGFVAYEAAPAFDQALRAHPAGRLPLAWFGVFGEPRVLSPRASSAAPTASWNARTGRGAYARAVESVRASIGRGDVYQVNYTVRLDVDLNGECDAMYRRLLAAQGGGYGAHIHTGQFEVLSASPELFFDRDGAEIVTRPMKGTARRGRWLEEDNERAAQLAESPKERAENVMIVDLIRNDLGRLAIPGSVQVTDMFSVARLPTVLQMTSTVSAALRDGVTTFDVFSALFPCGSVTGAPKVAASQMIATLEPDPRGVYCGAIGHIAPHSRATFNVAIRTLTVDRATGRAEYGTGSGITWDSANDAEYDEMLAKAAILTADLPQFELLETMRFEGGAFARRERHLSRLERSAEYFGFADPAALSGAAGRALDAFARDNQGSDALRVRLRVGPTGETAIEADALPSPPARLPHVAIARAPVRRNNRFLYHKTTHRLVYDRHRAEHPDAFDVLLWNEDGEVTEFTIGNVVFELDGTRVTPPRECGLLAGMFRQELLDSGDITERVIRRDDIARATRIWLVNSVREWVPCKL